MIKINDEVRINPLFVAFYYFVPKSDEGIKSYMYRPAVTIIHFSDGREISFDDENQKIFSKLEKEFFK